LVENSGVGVVFSIKKVIPFDKQGLIRDGRLKFQVFTILNISELGVSSFGKLASKCKSIFDAS